MEQVISLLFEIEEKANQIVKRAKDEKISLNESLEKDLAQLDKTIEDENTARLKVLKTQFDLDLEKAKQTLINDCDKHLAAMELNYQQNQTAIVNKIFQSIIKA
ncbi:MAG: hypothetical protein GX913_00425 [Clostridiales bacterium]|nr:hypothetical protein [Clostridiales bacterium]